MFKRWVFVMAALAAMFGGFIAYRSAGFERTQIHPELESFSLPDIEGRQRSTDEWKGEVLVINFWATWCPPCLEEIPQFMEIQKSQGPKGLQFIGIAVEDAEPVRAFAAKLNINYPILVAGMSGLGLSAALGNLAGVVPYSVVVNREGRIIHRQPGIFDPAKIRETVFPLL